MANAVQHKRKPSEFFAKILKVVRLCSAAVGADISNPNFRMNWITAVVIGSIVGYFVFTFSTILKMFKDDWTFLLEASCMAGSVIQGATKLIAGIVQTKKITSTRFLLEGIYRDFEQKGPKYVAALNRSCARTRNIVSVIGVCYLITATWIVSMPFVILIVTGKRHLMMHFHVPGLDVETTFGYFATLGAHSVCMFAGSFGLFAGDLFVVIYLTQSLLFVDIFELKIEQLNEMAANIENNNDRNSNTKQSLIDIVQWHQLYSKFTETCNNIFYSIITVQVSAAGISIVLTIFIVMTSDWPGAIPYLIITVYNLYVYCILGTKIEICNDEFTNHIYNISWYYLSVSEQKIVRQMLMQSQTPKTIDVGGVMPLSVNTALQITKTIYSITMMMIQFLIE